MDEKNFLKLVEGVEQLQASAIDVDIQRQDQQSSISKEEQEKSKSDSNEEESVKIIQQTTYIARRAMSLLVLGLQVGAIHASQNSKCFNSLSSAISYFRGQKGLYRPPIPLLVQWERNMALIDLFISNEGLYCNKRIAQDMFDICMETFDWLHSFANNNK